MQHIFLRQRSVLILTFVLVCTAVFPFTARAELAEFYPIVPVPSITDAGEITFGEYVNQIFLIAVSVGAILAVLMLIWGGFAYMTSDVVATKTKGLDRIRNALIGLILLLASYLVLYIINPCLVQITVFEGPSQCSPPIQEPEAQTQGTGGTFDPTTGVVQLPDGTQIGFPGTLATCRDVVEICVANNTQATLRTGATCTGGAVPMDVCLPDAQAAGTGEQTNITATQITAVLNACNITLTDEQRTTLDDLLTNGGSQQELEAAVRTNFNIQQQSCIFLEATALINNE